MHILPESVDIGGDGKSETVPVLAGAGGRGPLTVELHHVIALGLLNACAFVL